MRGARRADVVLVALFVLAIALPLLTSNVRAIVADDAEWVRPGMDVWGRWREGFGHEFGGRAWLLGMERTVKVQWLKSAPSDDVIVGRNGWLFLGHYRGYDGMADFLRTDPFTPDTLQPWVAHFQAKQQALAAQGVPYYVLFAPNKHTIYPEEMPVGLVPGRRPGRMEQLEAALRAAGIDVIEVTATLQERRSIERVYYRTDTHWNWGGAAAAYAATIHALQPRFPSLQPLPPRRTGIEVLAHGNLAIISGLPDCYPEDDANPMYEPQSPEQNARLEWTRAHGIDTQHAAPSAWVEQALIHVDRPSAQLESGLLIGDSFLHYGFGELIQQHFQHSERVFSHTLDLQQVHSLHPQVVLEEMVEEDLMLPPPPPIEP